MYNVPTSYTFYMHNIGIRDGVPIIGIYIVIIHTKMDTARGHYKILGYKISCLYIYEYCVVRDFMPKLHIILPRNFVPLWIIGIPTLYNILYLCRHVVTIKYSVCYVYRIYNIIYYNTLSV